MPSLRLHSWLLIRITPVLVLLITLPGLTGCLSPIALDHAAMAYNQSTADVLSKQLLLNIARAKHNEPIYFTGISNIAATFNFQANAGATPALTGESGSTILPLFGIAATENPTISIVPMDGEEFTRRMLSPIPENKMTLLLRQNIDIDLLLRLVALEFRYVERGDEVVYHNRPRNTEDYQSFRRMVIHLSTIQDDDAMYAEPIIFEQSWTLPIASVSAEGFHTLEKEYSISKDSAKAEYRLSKQIIGRTIITNFPTSILSNEERLRLNDEAGKTAPNDLLVDIRPGYPGGEYPMHGRFRMRSFSNILYFIGRTMGEEPETDVQKDPRTPAITENPIFVLPIQESDTRPSDGVVAAEYKDHYYSVQADKGYPWNRTAFRILSQIFQMTMAEVPKDNVPGIVISK